MSDSVYVENITLPLSMFSKDCDFIAIDKGCSLTKACIGKREGDSVKFACHTFKNSDFDSVLQWLAANGNIQSKTTVKITGVGGDLMAPTVAERLKCKVIFIDEFRAQRTGAEQLLINGSEAEIFYPDSPLLYESKMKTNSEVWNQMLEQNQQDDDDTCVTLFLYIGSATGLTWIGDESQRVVGGGSFVGGKSFLGLCNLVLDTKDFKEIDELAKKGDRGKIDLLGSDVFKDSKDPSYSAFPSEMSIFHFGKLADGLVKNENISREDKAVAVVGFFSEIFRTMIQANVSGKKCSRIVIGGNLIRSEYFRSEFFSGYQATSIFNGGKPLKFLRIGHTAAIGALLEDPIVK